MSYLYRRPLASVTPPPPKEPEKPKRRPAKVAQMLALAHDIQGKLDRGEYKNQAEAARACGVTRGWLTKLLDLTLLAPDIQENAIHIEAVDEHDPLARRQLRLARETEWPARRSRWALIRATV